MSKQDTAVFEKLLSWLQILENHIAELHEHRLVFETVRVIAKNNAELAGNVFYKSLKLWYSTSMSISVRRLVDKDEKSSSYLRFLELIKNNPMAISRERVMQAWEGHELATIAFDAYAGEYQEFLPCGFADTDIERLKQETKIVKDFADEYVAHNDLAPISNIPEFADLSMALKSLEAIHNKYASLLTGSTTHMEPIIPYTWENIFRRPWIDIKEWTE